MFSTEDIGRAFIRVLLPAFVLGTQKWRFLGFTHLPLWAVYFKAVVKSDSATNTKLSSSSLLKSYLRMQLSSGISFSTSATERGGGKKERKRSLTLTNRCHNY